MPELVASIVKVLATVSTAVTVWTPLALMAPVTPLISTLSPTLRPWGVGVGLLLSVITSGSPRAPATPVMLSSTEEAIHAPSAGWPAGRSVIVTGWLLTTPWFGAVMMIG